MKFFVYWYFYWSSLGGGHISGVIDVTDTTVTSYIYNEGYITWNIVEKTETRNDKFNLIMKAEYILEAHGVNSVMLISDREVEHYIQTDPPVHIKMKRK